MTTTISSPVSISPQPGLKGQLFTGEAVAFLTALHQKFGQRRNLLLQERRKRQAMYQQGILPDFLPETSDIRAGQWKIAAIPQDLQRRNVEITGPVDRKMVINALNSGADVFMADFEDANSPAWENCLNGQINLQLAIDRTLSFEAAGGKKYALNANTATLMVRPRGWHLPKVISGSVKLPSAPHFLISGFSFSTMPAA